MSSDLEKGSDRILFHMFFVLNYAVTAQILVNRFQKFFDLKQQMTRSDGILVRKNQKIGYTYTPKNKWLFLNDVELSVLLTENSPLSRNLVTVIDLGEKDNSKESLSTIRHMLMEALKYGDPRDSNHAIRDLIDQAVVYTLAGVERIVGKRLKKILHARLGFNKPFLKSSAFNMKERSFMGLHYDKYHDHKPEDDNIFYLIGLNIGLCERFFCFSGLTTNSIAEKRKILGQGNYVLDDSTSGVGSILKFYGNESIYRITIDPLQAYIVPTQCIIHDGMTNGKGLADICLFIACQFYDN